MNIKILAAICLAALLMAGCASQPGSSGMSSQWGGSDYSDNYDPWWQ